PRPMGSGFMTCARMCMNGVVTGISPTIMGFLPSAIRVVLTAASGTLLAEGRGAITLKSRVVRRAPAFLHSSSMPITDSESRVTCAELYLIRPVFAAGRAWREFQGVLAGYASDQAQSDRGKAGAFASCRLCSRRANVGAHRRW